VSDHQRGDWCRVWDALFWTFLNEKRSLIGKNPRIRVLYRYLTDRKIEEFRGIREEFMGELMGRQGL